MHTGDNFNVNLPIKIFDICICVLVCMYTHTHIYMHTYIKKTDTFSPIPLDLLGEEKVIGYFISDVILSLLPHPDQDR